MQHLHTTQLLRTIKKHATTQTLPAINELERRMNLEQSRPDTLTPLEKRILIEIQSQFPKEVTSDSVRTRLAELGFAGTKNNFDVNLSRLRTKLEKSGSGTIKTRRGIGYSWVPRE